MAASDAGQMVLPPIAGFIAIVVAWQLGLAFIIPLLLLVALWLWRTVPTSSSEEGTVHGPADAPWEQLLVELKRPQIGIATLILIVYGVVWAAFTGFYPTYLIEIKGFSGTEAALLFGLFFGIGIIVKPIAGNAFDRVGPRRSLLGVVTLPVFAFASLPIADSVLVIAIMTAAAAPLLGSGAILLPYVLDVFPERIRGRGIATVRTIFLFIAALSPTIFGTIAEIGYFDEIYYILSALTIVVVVLAVLLPSSQSV